MDKKSTFLQSLINVCLVIKFLYNCCMIKCVCSGSSTKNLYKQTCSLCMLSNLIYSLRPKIHNETIMALHLQSQLSSGSPVSSRKFQLTLNCIYAIYICTYEHSYTNIYVRTYINMCITGVCMNLCMYMQPEYLGWWHNVIEC